MKYSNSEIKKNFIQLNNIEMTFDKNGIYLIHGENGSGKTTLLETILFDQKSCHFEFESEIEQEALRKNRYNLFSYVSQKSIDSEVRVFDVITKMNTNFCRDEIELYCDKFKLPNTILDAKYCNLSGGEKKKIDIVSALLKNTPYCFLDEPTNYLDEGSVNALKDVINFEAQRKKIIIITHDPRLNLKAVREYVLDNGNVIEKENLLSETKEFQPDICEIPNNKNLNIIKMFLRMTKNGGFVISCLSMVLVLIDLLLLTSFSIENSIAEGKGNHHDSILIYNVGGGHDALNEMYERSEHINVEAEQLDKCIDYDNLIELAQKKHIDNIYIPNEQYISELWSCLENNQTNMSSVFSCPNMLVEQYTNIWGDYFGLRYTAGSIPRDGKNEVAISKSFLIKYFGYDKKNVNDAIGEEVVINNKKYKIVGYSYYDIIIVSYENKNADYGYYSYDNNTYADFCKKQKKYIQNIDGDYAIRNVLISINEKYEKELLNFLIKEYPSDCYQSKAFENSFHKQQKHEAFVKWLGITILFSFIYAIIMCLIIKKTIKYNINIIYDIGNYFMNRKGIVKKYMFIQCFAYIMLGLCMCIANYWLFKYYYITNYYIVTALIITIIPIMLISFKEYKEVQRK